MYYALHLLQATSRQSGRKETGKTGGLFIIADNVSYTKMNEFGFEDVVSPEEAVCGFNNFSS
jgi:hypothetical protein